MHITIMMEEEGRVYHFFYQGRIISWYYGQHTYRVFRKNLSKIIASQCRDFLHHLAPSPWILSPWYDPVWSVGSPTGTWPPWGWLWGRGTWPGSTPGPPDTLTMTGSTPTQWLRKRRKKRLMCQIQIIFETFYFYWIYFHLDSKVDCTEVVYLLGSWI